MTTLFQASWHRSRLWALSVGGWTLFVASALARPTAPQIFCETYPAAPYCSGRVSTCATCHESTAPVSWNPYGLAIAAELRGDFETSLPEALRATNEADADGDGQTNLDEIMFGSAPGSSNDYCEPLETDERLTYDVMLAVRRAGALFCGQSPSYEALALLSDASNGEEQRGLLHDQVETCLSSEYWRDEGLARIADPLIRPIAAVNVDSPIGIPLADFDYDYRLFSYVLTGDRDARELLTAQYHVKRRDDGTLEKVEGVINGPEMLAGELNSEQAGGQPLLPERRAGMITTQWFLVINTMFSALPRTTAAQAYRSYLGMDIALQEGILPVAGEPIDVDNKGVAAPTCAQCHSTLDPLSYAFVPYEGLRGPTEIHGNFSESRATEEIPEWSNPRSVLFGTEVPDLVSWAQLAVESDAFKRNLALLFFRHMFGRDPVPTEEPGFEAAFRALPTDGYSANRLIHRLVDLGSFGGA